MSSDPLRRRTMQAIKSTNTAPELQVRRMLSCAGFRYRLHRRDLPGSPDIVFPGKRKAIFVHGCFWHCHACARGMRTPKENSSYWIPKLEGNAARDKRNLQLLKGLGWSVAIVWECELKEATRVRKKLFRFLMHH